MEMEIPSGDVDLWKTAWKEKIWILRGIRQVGLQSDKCPKSVFLQKAVLLYLSLHWLNFPWLPGELERELMQLKAIQQKNPNPMERAMGEWKQEVAEGKFAPVSESGTFWQL